MASVSKLHLSSWL